MTDESDCNPAAVTHVSGVGHYGLTVRSLEAAVPFYVDVLGFAVGDRIELDSDFSSQVTGVPDARITVLLLHGHGAVLELLEYDADMQRSSTSASPDVPGATHLAFYVQDTSATVAHAGAHGWKLAGGLAPIATGPRAGGVAAYLTNDDGHVVEIVQRPVGDA